MTAAIGAMLGTFFSPAVFAHAPSWLIALAGMAVFIGAAGGISYLYFR